MAVTSYRVPSPVLHPICFVESVPGAFLLEKVTIPPIEVSRLVLAQETPLFNFRGFDGLTKDILDLAAGFDLVY